jgi:hypothetical protein
MPCSIHSVHISSHSSANAVHTQCRWILPRQFFLLVLNNRQLCELILLLSACRKSRYRILPTTIGSSSWRGWFTVPLLQVISFKCSLVEITNNDLARALPSMMGFRDVASIGIANIRPLLRDIFAVDSKVMCDCQVN